MEVIQFAEGKAQKLGLDNYVVKRQNSQKVEKQQQPVLSKIQQKKQKAEEKKAAEKTDKIHLAGEASPRFEAAVVHGAERCPAECSEV